MNSIVDFGITGLKMQPIRTVVINDRFTTTPDMNDFLKDRVVYFVVPAPSGYTMIFYTDMEDASDANQHPG